MTEKIFDTYPTMRMQRLGSMIVVQPWLDGKVAGQSCTCDLETGTLSLVDHPAIDKNFTPIFGILGMASLEAGPALVVITGVEHVAYIRSHPLLRVTSTQVLADTGNRKWRPTDYKFLRLLNLGVDPERYGQGLYFSCGGDPTLTQQKYEALKADAASYYSTPAWKRAEQAFFWNKSLARPLLDAGMDQFVPTAFVGFAEQLDNLDFSRGSRRGIASIILIARRSAHRAGTRQWRRGAGNGAEVANYIESEQIVSFDNGAIQASFVQIRGSIPLLWSQTPNLKYKIPITIASQSACQPIFAAHAKYLTNHYGHVTAVNLANQTGREGKLSAAYATAAASIANEIPEYRLVPFDFHKKCGATNYKNLEILWNDVSDDFANYSYWYKDARSGIQTTQGGVFRTNCIDTLDRTNVVQGLFARRALEHLLRRLSLLTGSEQLAVAFPQIEPLFRVMWADHGDEISRQYAGTGAMKSAFTRTGKRDLAGLIDDGNKSLTRYFLNNFRDGEKQDAIDFVTGAYRLVPGSKAPFEAQGSPALLLISIIGLLMVAFGNAQKISIGNGSVLSVEGVKSVWVFVVVAMVLLKLMFKFGKYMVNRPNLRPDLSVPWVA